MRGCMRLCDDRELFYRLLFFERHIHTGLTVFLDVDPVRQCITERDAANDSTDLLSKGSLFF